jgi:fructose-1,6-bisphosphatase
MIKEVSIYILLVQSHQKGIAVTCNPMAFIVEQAGGKASDGFGN